MKAPEKAPRLITGDCTRILPTLPSSSIHMVLTDPPYFLHQLGQGWNPDQIQKARNHSGTVKSLPRGMAFDSAQGRQLQAFLAPIARELLRVLKPGGFALCFAAPRLHHRAALAFEEAGFEIRDGYAWRFTKKAQFKAFTLDHFIRKKQGWTKHRKEKVIRDLGGRRTPQLKPQFEMILCAQKPREGTFLENWQKHRTGLIDPTHSLNGRAPETVMTVEKETRDEFNQHLTPKPVRLCEHLIRLFSAKGQTILDPFLGSGTTCLAARNTGRQSIGIEIHREYIQTAEQRLKEKR